MAGLNLKTLQAQHRSTAGKGAARQIRIGGMMPAVLYGKDHPVQNLTLRPEDLIHGFARDEFPGRYTELVIQDEEGKEIRHLVKILEIQQDPVTLRPLHADFHVVDAETVRTGLLQAEVDRVAEEKARAELHAQLEADAAAAAVAEAEAAEAAEAAAGLEAAAETPESSE